MQDVVSLDLPVADDYVPSAGELNNLVYLICKYTVSWQMRATDLAICLSLAGKVVGNEGLSKLCSVTCDYVWDHICGEPDNASASEFFEHMKPILQGWYENTTPEQRSDTN